MVLQLLILCILTRLVIFILLVVWQKEAIANLCSFSQRVPCMLLLGYCYVIESLAVCFFLSFLHAFVLVVLVTYQECNGSCVAAYHALYSIYFVMQISSFWSLCQSYSNLVPFHIMYLGLQINIFNFFVIAESLIFYYYLN